MKSIAGSRYGLFSTAAILTLYTGQAQAQSQVAPSIAPSSEPMQDIVVTAQRRSERLQDVPISIAVMSGAKLDSSTSSGTTDALTSVAGVAVSQSTQNNSSLITIRGVSAGASALNGASTVGFYIDSLPFGFVKSAIAPDLSIYDLDRIEVLRGPQGTLYGASSQNGVVRVLTHDADFNIFELKARGSLSSTYHGGESYRGDTAANIPLVDDMLAARLVLGYQHLGGWIDRANEKDANHSRVENARLRVRFEPTSRLKVGVSGMITTNDYGAPSSAAEPYFDTSLISEPGSTRIEQYGVNASYDFDTFSVSAASGWLSYKSRAILDYAPFPPDTMGVSKFGSRIQSDELNIRSTTKSDWQWSVGAIYRNGRDPLFQSLTGFVTIVPIQTSDISKSYAFFGELTRFLFDRRLEIMLGARYFHDHVTTREDAPFDGNPSTPLLSADAKFNKVSPRAVFTWHQSPDLTLYASYGQGFRSGFPQNPAVVRAAPGLQPAKPDNLTNYEIGAKGSLFDHRLTFNGALYYIKWADVQQTLKIPYQGTFFNAVTNGTGASGVGVDFSVEVEPIHGLHVAAAVGWNNLRTDGPTISNGVVLFDKGDRLDLSPAFTGSASAQYTFPLSSNLNGELGVSGTETSSQTMRTIGYIGHSGDVFIGKASFSLSRPDRWTLSVFVDNFNNFHDVFAPSNIANFYPNWLQRIRPRTIGAQFEVHFR